MSEDIMSLGLADWISDSEPNYPSLEECKEWIKFQQKNNEYVMTEKDEEDIKMLLKYIPMSQLMNKNLSARYLDQIFEK
tara:strand:- start:78 stop:314 length:237 start_codon:yes stop_codon:yes gene_type:complete